jgi:hypothetical protein
VSYVTAEVGVEVGGVIAEGVPPIALAIPPIVITAKPATKMPIAFSLVVKSVNFLPISQNSPYEGEYEL